MAKAKQEPRRRKGEGRIFKKKLPSGKLSKYYTLRYHVNGKPKDISLNPATTLREAEKEAKKYLPNIKAKNEAEIKIQISQAKEQLFKAESNMFELSEKSLKISLSNVWKYFIDSTTRRQNTKENTLRGYKRSVDRFIEWSRTSVNIKYAEDVTENIAKSYFSNLNNKGYSNSTYNNYLVGINVVFRDVLNSSPFSVIKPKHEDKKTHLLLTDHQVVDLLKVFKDNSFYIMDKSEMETVFLFGVCTGARLIDCCMIKEKYFNLGEKIVSYMPVKTKRYRRTIIAPVSSLLYENLLKYNIKNSNEYILKKIVERFERNPKGVREDIRKVFVHAGIKEKQIEFGSHGNRGLNFKYKDVEDEIIGFHCLRHKFITKCVENDMNIAKLSKIVGDNIKTLEKYYIKLEKEAILKEKDKLPSYF